jgi:hypothetical protein
MFSPGRGKRRRTMRITNLLALAVVTVVAAACNGISPTSPNTTATSEDATALVDANAGNVAAADTGTECRAITEVEMQLLRSTDAFYVRIEAVYMKGRLPSRCRVAPVWDSRPGDQIIQTRDPFVVKIFRGRQPITVQVNAQAPNGVQGSIRVH